ncbi:C-X-C motif chemokine 13 [Python bivittatus]|uniref:C-X-C motif chemokine 13 n=1 Tax=Python bivittatus TaxID=176946 RepID=A0A9F5J2S4_PYTBI|nr:C-X-C motif chemokine 13 [Python bivittatus]
MKSLILILTVALVASNINHIYGLAMEGHIAHLGRCKCLKHIALPFAPTQVKHIEVIPQRIHCRRMEIILTLKNSWKYCIHPNTPWVTALLKKWTKRLWLQPSLRVSFPASADQPHHFIKLDHP